MLVDNNYIFVLLWSFSRTATDRQTDQSISLLYLRYPTAACTALAWHHAVKHAINMNRVTVSDACFLAHNSRKLTSAVRLVVFLTDARSSCVSDDVVAVARLNSQTTERTTVPPTDDWTYDSSADNAAALFWIVSCCCCCVSCAVRAGFLTFQRTFYQRYVHRLRSMVAWLPLCLLVYLSWCEWRCHCQVLVAVNKN